MHSNEIKIAYIGGGSRYWARDLFAELAQTPRLGGRIDLYDIDQTAASRNVAVADAIFARPEAKTRFSVRAVTRLRDALRQADFVLLSIEPGSIENRFADLVIPARHGILQPVGDTTGPGGLLRAMRAVPLYAEFARQIAEHCPSAWVINFTNPMTLCTAALYATAPKIKAFGCCHEVFHTQGRLARFVAEWFDVPVPPRQEIAIDLTGVNHFTWVTAATWNKRQLLPKLNEEITKPVFLRSRSREARANKKAERWFDPSSMVAFDLLRRFGALGAAGDRHLSEFVSWYARSESELHRWGVLLTPYPWRLRRARLKDRDSAFYRDRPLVASDEEGVRLIEALLGLIQIDTNVNLPNQGQVPELPLGHIVETNAQFRRDRVTPLISGRLPIGAAALVRRVADVQKIALQASLSRDVDLAFQALLNDPLLSLPTDHAWTMFKAMLHHARSALPGWRLPT